VRSICEIIYLNRYSESENRMVLQK